MHCQLADIAAKRAAERDDPAEQLGDLAPGTVVKLLFDHLEGGEHIAGESMWVEVEDRDADCYRGRMRSNSRVNDHLRFGARVAFEPRHIIGVE